MKGWHWVTLLITLLLAGCSAPSTQLAALDAGFGGTGALPCSPTHAHGPGDSGFGGTGHQDQCGFGGTGIIGTITDFGSIWVNGLEIELTQDLTIQSNLGHPVKLAIGQQVITRTEPNALVTDRVEVFYPIAGAIERKTGTTIEVAGRIIRLDQHTQGWVQAQKGDYVAINALPQADGSWLATRIDPNPSKVEKVERPSLKRLETHKALLEGTILDQNGQLVLAPYNLPLSETEAQQLKHGALALVQVAREASRWQVEQIQTLHHWRMDWRQLPKPTVQLKQTDGLRPSTHFDHDATRHYTREQFDATETLKTQQNTAHEQWEQLQSLHERQEDISTTSREQMEQLNEHRELLPAIQTQREQSEMIQQQRDTMSTQRDMLDQTREHAYPYER